MRGKWFLGRGEAQDGREFGARERDGCPGFLLLGLRFGSPEGGAKWRTLRRS